MPRFDVALFDLDGTLTDPAEGITRSVVYALDKFGIKEKEERLLKFIGPPLKESFMKFYGFSDGDAALAIKYYREYYSERGIFENRVSEGVLEGLEKLKAAGVELAVATSKPQPFAVRILQKFGLYGYFAFVGGATMDETRTRKEEVIEYVLENLRPDRKKTVMIGDREHDILGAAACGISSVGVLFGYGTREELEAAGADFIARNMRDVLSFIQNSPLSAG